MIRWKKGKPTKPGIYLRSNPPISAIIRQDVFEIEGELCVAIEPGSATQLKNWEGANSMWWYGPIPCPTWQTKRKK